MGTAVNTKKQTEFGTIHIFGYGETQVNAPGGGYKCDTTKLKTVQAVIDNVYASKPADQDVTEQYHAIHIHSGMHADFQPKSGKGFRVDKDKIDATLIEALVTEVFELKTQEEADKAAALANVPVDAAPGPVDAGPASAPVNKRTPVDKTKKK